MRLKILILNNLKYKNKFTEWLTHQETFHNAI